MKTASSLYRTPDIELTGHALELGRPELKTLMNRYSLSTRSPQGTLLGPWSALIVSKHPGDEAPMREALEKEGWFVKSCPGPGTPLPAAVWREMFVAAVGRRGGRLRGSRPVRRNPWGPASPSLRGGLRLAGSGRR